MSETRTMAGRRCRGPPETGTSRGQDALHRIPDPQPGWLPDPGQSGTGGNLSQVPNRRTHLWQPGRSGP